MALQDSPGSSAEGGQRISPRSFIEAAKKGDSLAVDALLAAGVDLETQDLKRGDTALNSAASKGLLEVVDRLVAAGADVNAQDESKNTALILAIYGRHLAVVKRLIAAGVDVNAQNAHGHTALILAAREGDTEAVDCLIAAGADLNRHTKDGVTALIMAAKKRRVAVVDRLIAAGADLNAQSEDAETALDCAVRRQSAGIVDRLITAAAERNAVDGSQLICPNKPRVIAALLDVAEKNSALEAVHLPCPWNNAIASRLAKLLVPGRPLRALSIDVKGRAHASEQPALVEAVAHSSLTELRVSTRGGVLSLLAPAVARAPRLRSLYIRGPIRDRLATSRLCAALRESASLEVLSLVAHGQAAIDMLKLCDIVSAFGSRPRELFRLTWWNHPERGYTPFMQALRTANIRQLWWDSPPVSARDYVELLTALSENPACQSFKTGSLKSCQERSFGTFIPEGCRSVKFRKVVRALEEAVANSRLTCLDLPYFIVFTTRAQSAAAALIDGLSRNGNIRRLRSHSARPLPEEMKSLETLTLHAGVPSMIESSPQLRSLTIEQRLTQDEASRLGAVLERPSCRLHTLSVSASGHIIAEALRVNTSLTSLTLRLANDEKDHLALAHALRDHNRTLRALTLEVTKGFTGFELSAASIRAYTEAANAGALIDMTVLMVRSGGTVPVTGAMCPVWKYTQTRDALLIGLHPRVGAESVVRTLAASSLFEPNLLRHVLDMCSPYSGLAAALVRNKATSRQAFLMGLHARVGAESALATLPSSPLFEPSVLRRVFEMALSNSPSRRRECDWIVDGRSPFAELHGPRIDDCPLDDGDDLDAVGGAMTKSR